MLRTVVEARTLVAMMVAACVGTWGLRAHPVDQENLFLALIAAKDPTVFHVRDDGWMGAAFNFAAPYTIEPGKPLKLRYGLWVHAGVPTPATIDEQFAAFAKIGDVPAAAK